KELKMENYIQSKLKQLKFKTITPIQEEIFKNFHKPFHLVGISPTGTGKTHAYLLPILNQINWNKNTIQAIVVVPTNELIFQILKMSKEVEPKSSQIKILYRGMDKQKILKTFEKKQPPLIITTLDKLAQYDSLLKVIKFYQSSLLVLDEADMLFDQNSLSLLDNLLIKWQPKILLFSASITENMTPFINKYFGKSLFLNVNDKQKLNLKYYALLSYKETRLNDLMHLMKNLNPYSALIFFSTKQEQSKVYTSLKELKLNILNFHSDLTIEKRKYFMNEIRKAKYQYILASDLVSRGLDLDIEWVIHYDLPHKNLEFFQHRSGRTGRMGKEGKIIVFYDEKDKETLNKLKIKNNIIFKEITLNKNGFSEKEKKEPRTTKKIQTFLTSPHKKNVPQIKKNYKIKKRKFDKNKKYAKNR
ncbi:DEAD/DEAH box helicase, partial ['Camptotheca acuminata' phytoplasma]|uniref:DEAD/DEAH box helicase n=1 Tax='Camptotheca acuminata' phytoplasma TaxID=3239192 RepID=UPI003519EEC5